MRLFSYCFAVVTALCTPLTASAIDISSVNPASSVRPDSQPDNSNHVFNAIHSSMRQWGSSWHHNGMSFFLATVPAATQFYHGTGEPDFVTGPEWLAFEPEHAIVFARGRGEGPPGGGPGRGPPGERKPGRPPPPGQEPFILDNGPHHGPPPSHASEPGWFQTYVTKHPLSLLYIDGMSGGKTDKGTLDSQDYLLLNLSSSTENPGRGEGVRAQRLCEFANTKWQNKVDGILRMEAGFEIILCDFERHLNLVSVVGAGGDSHPSKGPGGQDMWTWLRAVTARYNGIGGDRVTIDYENFVSAYTYDLDLFRQATKVTDPLPRLNNISPSSLDIVRRDVDDLILDHAHKQPTSGTTNWQAKADMIVTRYSTLLLQLLDIQNKTLLQQRVNHALAPFINSDDRNNTAEVERCTHQFLPYHSQPPCLLAYTSLLSISHKICSTLFSVLSSTSNLDSSISAIKSLRTYLSWSSFADCPEACGLEEICLIPIWPVGSKKAHAQGHGYCVTEDLSDEDGDYWHDGPGWGGPGKGRHGGAEGGSGDGQTPPPTGDKDKKGRGWKFGR